MTTIDTSKWEFVGETSNVRYYVVREDVLAVVPPLDEAIAWADELRAAGQEKP